MEKIYAKGLWAKKPISTAPSFVKGSLSIKVTDFIDWLKENENDSGYVNIDLLDKKSDPLSMNAVLNNYKKIAEGQPTKQDIPAKNEFTNGYNDDDLPF